jgi:hypothetical protein
VTLVAALFFAVEASWATTGLMSRYEKIVLPPDRALNAVKLDLVVTPPLPTAKVEAAIRTWGVDCRREFAELLKLPVRQAIRRDIIALRHWTTMLVADLEAYDHGHFPSKTNGDLARHNAAAARVDHDFGVTESG